MADFDKGIMQKKSSPDAQKKPLLSFRVKNWKKMASDEKYAKDYMDRVQGAVRMSEQINQQFGF